MTEPQPIEDDLQAEPEPGPRSLERVRDPIDELCSRQGGVVSRPQLLDLGLSIRAIDGWSQRGLLLPVARWVYSPWGAQVQPLGRRWAATLSVGNAACVTGAAAFDGHDLLKARHGPIDVLIASGNPRPQAGVRVHRTRRLPPEDVVTIDGLRYAAPARAIFDESPSLSTDRIDQLLDRLMHLRSFDLAAFERLYGQWPTHAGVTAMRAAIARLDETAGRNRSELERKLVRLIVSSHLPTPAVNSRVEGVEVDIRWPDCHAILEADGREFHTSPAQIAADNEKVRKLEAAGFAVRRFDWNAVTYRPVETLQEAEAFRLAHLGPPRPRR